MTDPYHPLSVRDSPLLTHYFARQDTRLCNASAGAAVLWQPYFQDAALEVDGTLLLREQFPGLGTVVSTPIGVNGGNAYVFLVKYCRAVGQPVQFFPAEALRAAPGSFTPSAFVQSVTGVDNVCERSAVLAAGGPLV